MRYSFARSLQCWVLSIALIASAVSLAQAQRPDVIYVPTPHETVTRMLDRAEVSAKDFVIDLGSGDGRIVIAAAKRGARAMGIEIAPDRIAEARANAQAAGLAERAIFRQENLFSVSLAEATVITLYLLPELNERLRPSILELRPGTRVVSHQFPMGDWKPDVTDTDGGTVYLWIVPARVAGTWQLRLGERSFTLNLKQQYQELSGIATFGTSPATLRDARLRGAEIEFTVEMAGQPVRFRGAVAGNSMQGTTDSPAAAQWQATRS